MTIPTGTQLTCTNDDCPCQLLVQTPCPHGDDFTCGCGHPFETSGVAGGPDGPSAPEVHPGA